MSAVESALDVLSRAATMVQELLSRILKRGSTRGSWWSAPVAVSRVHDTRRPFWASMEISARRRCLWQPWLAAENFRTVHKPGEERPKATNLHRKPSSAWRKERRRDPIQSEALDMSAARVHHHHHSRPSVIVPTTPQPGTTIEDTAVTPTPSLTPSAATGGQRTGVRTVGGVSDPAIDEHFKRSLGLEEYAAVFNATTTDKEAGLSVDDHFAKALGETWTRLQATGRGNDST